MNDNQATLNSKPLATMTLQGWTRDIGKQIDFAIAYCFESNASQSYIFEGQILSFQKIIHDFSRNYEGMCSAMQSELESYLKSLFDDAVVEVTHNAATTKGSGVSLFVYATVTVNGKTYTTSAGTEIEDSKIIRFFNLNNEGAAY